MFRQGERTFDLSAFEKPPPGTKTRDAVQRACAAIGLDFGGANLMVSRVAAKGQAQAAGVGAGWLCVGVDGHGLADPDDEEAEATQVETSYFLYTYYGGTYIETPPRPSQVETFREQFVEAAEKRPAKLRLGFFAPPPKWEYLSQEGPPAKWAAFAPLAAFELETARRAGAPASVAV